MSGLRVVVAAVLAGALFGLGLAVSGMTDAQRIIGFLDVFGAFDPTLAFVLGGAVATTLVTFRFVLKRPHPLLTASFVVPAARAIDGRLIAGAALFGVGWGLAGYCPGPALVNLGVGAREALWFVPAMVAGLWLHRIVAGR